jgi:hypothetical protein
MRSWARVCIVLGSLAAMACGGDDDDDDANNSPFVTLAPEAAFPGTPGDAASYARLFEFQPLPGCDVGNARDLNGATELRLFRGSGVTDSNVREFASGLQRYYSQYGVVMSTRYTTLPVPLDRALILDVQALTARVKSETGLDIDAELTLEEQERATASVGEAILWNVKELIRVYGEPRRDVVNVVVLPGMVGDVPEEFASFRNLAGLGFSPELLATVPADDPAHQLYEWLNVSEDFTPVAILGMDVVHQFFSAPDVAIAHEVGHAYGLTHVPGEGTNLMNPAVGACSLPLDEGQLEKVAAATRAIALGMDAEAASLTDRAGEFVTALHRFVATRAGR